ncbi:unnamed protein product [Pocillopora meandrina]|uniref:ABC transmembrane type-1 domain-containing protein n=1 Tax=Pocillopora meandrina TaxID=46732 RepID=A0AAU9WKB4_9CNID|nr:unnamed protein product [Pocillopora meandrina]
MCSVRFFVIASRTVLNVFWKASTYVSVLRTVLNVFVCVLLTVFHVSVPRTILYVFCLIVCYVLSFILRACTVLKEAKSTLNLKMTLSYRYFSHQELRNLFTLEDPHHSKTQLQLDH